MNAVMQGAQPAEEIKACAWCHGPFTPRRSWAKYCGRVCRELSNERKHADGLRATVSSVRALRRGGVSITLRFTAIERERALKLEPGKLVGVLAE